MENLQVYLAEFEDEKIIKMVMHSERYPEYEKFFRHQNDYFMRAIETVESIDIITKNVGTKSSLTDIISTEYLKDRYKQKGHDLRLADFSNVKKVVMVGCGPFPDTILYIYENTNVPEIVGLDYNEEAIHISSQFIHGLGFNRIKLECIDGTLYDYNDTDLVYIAGFVRPKHKILKRIAETSKKKNITIIIDSILGMQELLFESINENNLHPRLRIEKRDYSRSAFYRQEIIKVVKYDI
jgi:uncharacterized UPF0146 family protein